MHYISFLSGITDFSKSKELCINHGIIVKEYDDLYLLKYDKSTADMNNLDIQKCRGLLIEKNTNKIVCVPPRKSVDIDYYHTKFKENDDTEISEIICEEFIDGTMINVFKYKDKVCISTRSCLNANCR